MSLNILEWLIINKPCMLTISLEYIIYASKELKVSKWLFIIDQAVRYIEALDS